MKIVPIGGEKIAIKFAVEKKQITNNFPYKLIFLDIDG